MPGGPLRRRAPHRCREEGQAHRRRRSARRVRDVDREGGLAMPFTPFHMILGCVVAGGIADGGLIGDVGLFLAEDGREAEVGFTLRRESQGRGLATAAVRESIALVFEQTDVERVLGITDMRNLASIRLLQRVGMAMIESRGSKSGDEPCIEHVYA